MNTNETLTSLANGNTHTLTGTIVLQTPEYTRISVTGPNSSGINFTNKFLRELAVNSIVPITASFVNKKMSYSSNGTPLSVC